MLFNFCSKLKQKYADFMGALYIMVDKGDTNM